MTMDGDLRRGAFARPTAALWIVLAAALCCLPGFLESPLGPYDESALVLGARLMNNGLLPYVDFYTIYGPLAYDLMRPFLLVGDPGIAYRVAQMATFAGAILLLFLVLRHVPGRRGHGVLAILTILNLSAAAFGPHFFGFALALAAIALFAAASDHEGGAGWLWILLAGAALGLTILTRPAFGAYVGGSVLIVALATSPQRLGGLRVAGTRLAGLFACAALVAAVTWLLLFRSVPPEDAFVAAIVFPTIIFRSSARALLPYLLPSDVSAAIQVGFAILVSVSVFLLAMSGVVANWNRAVRRCILGGAMLAAAAPGILVLSSRPGDAMWFVSATLFAASALALGLGRHEVARSPYLRRAAFFGLPAIAFLHYFWSRADVSHLTPSLCLASVAALCASPEYGRGGRRILTALLVPSAVALSMTSYTVILLPRAAARLASSGFSASWPASVVPPDARLAVGLADRLAEPSSRFVAVASNHRRTDVSPILLYLLSTRRPYTRWYSYDPGIQSSPTLQAQMIQELERSSSATAVIWRTESFRQGKAEDGQPAPTALDRRIAELYPITLGRFGDYEVRGRAGTRSDARND